MATRRILPDTVVLANYIGEIDDVASFQYTTIKNVYCYSSDGVSVDSLGRRRSDEAKLYIFDRTSKATDKDGNAVQYLPYSEWNKLSDKSGYWTLCDGGRDTFRKLGTDKEFRITRFSKFYAGTPRMWHFEVAGA